jgi:hypothetical protein
VQYPVSRESGVDVALDLLDDAAGNVIETDDDLSAGPHGVNPAGQARVVVAVEVYDDVSRFPGVEIRRVAFE